MEKLAHLQHKCNIVFRKRKGESVVAGTAMLAISVICVFLLIRILFDYYSKLHNVEEVNYLARSYLLKIELNGQLEQEDHDQIVNRLRELGMTNIELSGNFSSSISSGYIKVNEMMADYADTVYLRIKGTMTDSIDTIDFLGTEYTVGEATEVDVKKEGIAVK